MEDKFEGFIDLGTRDTHNWGTTGTALMRGHQVGNDDDGRDNTGSQKDTRAIRTRR